MSDQTPPKSKQDSAPTPDGPRPETTGGSGAAEAGAPPPRGPIGWFLGVIERVGNLLPHPVTLFAIFGLMAVVGSEVAVRMAVSVPDPRPGAAEGAVLTARSLMSAEGFRWICTNLVRNFTGFAPLGTVLVALLGVGIAERSGLLSAAIRALVLAAPPHLVTVVIVFAGVLSNAASEMGYIVLIPMAMAIFHALGRHPLAGLAAAFAGVSGVQRGLVLGTIDPLLSGITRRSRRRCSTRYSVNPACSWYFMILSTFLITGLEWFVTARSSSRGWPVRPGDAETGTTPRRSSAHAGGAARALAGGRIAAGAGVRAVGAGGPRWLGAAGIHPRWGLLRDPTSLSGAAALGPLMAAWCDHPGVLLGSGIVYGAATGSMRRAVDHRGDGGGDAEHGAVSCWCSSRRDSWRSSTTAGWARSSRFWARGGGDAAG